ncbi:CvpA family protein [Ferrovum sp. PN-J185]|uniref:CvpA family protein n=1 Tax=Ferrovum sp. PN-J185 TaxID=1356306 RepID=UPI0007913471|nr:CvpA family protein [Ferrovum sp. PN-J185]KXW55770.1 colicin V production protein [Ferrovum sp. PN-J185]MCC6068532.1 CvpA family protein [Ferrovum sp. PN-J185]MDE1892155.1 CvpA family protein [Betaproteobacteria bacterium]
MSIEHLNWIDYVAIGLIGLSTLFGLFRGMVKEVMGIVGWVAAFILAKLTSPILANYLIRFIDNPSLRLVAAFVIVFIVVLIIVAIISSMLGFAVEKTGLGSLNRLLGATFGLVRGYFIFLILIILAGFTLLPQQADWQTSTSVKIGLWGVSHLKPYLPQDVAQFFHF